MKKLEIVVRSEKLDDVKSILDEWESTGAMVSNIMGYGNQKGYKTTYRGSEYVVNLIPKVKIETIAFIMAKHADPSIPDTPEEWLDNFNTFSIYQVLPQLIELWGLNVKTDVEAKKNFVQQSVK